MYCNSYRPGQHLVVDYSHGDPSRSQAPHNPCIARPYADIYVAAFFPLACLQRALAALLAICRRLAGDKAKARALPPLRCVWRVIL